ncbi:uncharacterized protein SEPMUDRAFT_37223 [Sphaerulina musiva SO2202]|uniref:CENP-V/GFA domain-containing protein n=1 Tax=Sphaerulina musiva (strain SO2202) TaxID=692275 RepID=M3DAV1_SPHMS|nr:uncharacterized protein SEPMUDRAFT_37223 [Sphaerulina musiva SO2202]EMF14969.1 hypothetical protein SEPMUDRAFT_37223 [Sphaerulina musiva SO2202]
MPTKGSCVCGEWTYEYEGEPSGVAICYCIPCRKTAGSNGSYNLMIPLDKFKKLSGTNFLYTRTGDSGKPINYTNCGKCGTIMTADVQALEGVVLVKGGTVDDLTLDAKLAPKVEIYRKTAPEWCTPVAGAALKEVS